VHAFIGDVDTYAKFHDVDGWEMYTTGEFTVHREPGGHLFYKQRPEEFMNELTRLLEENVRRLQIGPDEDIIPAVPAHESTTPRRA
jgi:surfactin synthase thioesterase subunit